MGTPLGKLTGGKPTAAYRVMFAIDVKLVLFMLALPAALVEAAQEPCCYSKEAYGKTFTLIESNSDEVTAYGCDTANNCIYGQDGTNDRYCFKRGGQEVPACLQELPTCSKYFVRAVLNDVPQQAKIETLFYDINDNNTCAVPSIPWEGDNKRTFSQGKYIYSGGEHRIFDYKITGDRETEMLKLEGGSWKNHSLVTPADFPVTKYEIATWKNELYALGGQDASAYSARVYKSVDGITWNKLGWELPSARIGPYACITTNQQSGKANLVTFGGSGAPPIAPEVIIYDLEDNDPAASKVSITINTMLTDIFKVTETRIDHKLICHDGWMHVVSTTNYLISLKLTNSYNGEGDFLVEGSPIRNGVLITYQGKVGLVGGDDSDGVNKYLFYFNPSNKTWLAGSEFPWYQKVGRTSQLVPVISA